MEGFLSGLALALIVGALLPNTSVTKEEYEWSYARCEANGGVAYVRGEGAIRALSVICQNGAKFNRPVNEGV